MEEHIEMVNQNFVLPSKEIQKFLFDVINQTNFPGNMVEFVSDVKQQISRATVAQ